MNTSSIYQVAIIGGGLAGLSLSITLAQQGYRVIVFEKETYPFHRVCGEYISMESRPFLDRLGLPLDSLDLPVIRQLRVSAPDGFTLIHPLDLGGFGISRYTLDALLAERALASGVVLQTGSRVTSISFEDDAFGIRTATDMIRAEVAVGSFGKRSNLDVQLQRPFIQRKAGKLNNYIGIKYHIRLDLPEGEIALHNFEDGYCGVSAVEGGLHCLCYLTTAANLERGGGNIRRMEDLIVCKNPMLRDIFSRARFDWAKPESIAQVSFSPKAAVDQHLLMTGDAAGLISPLCGNGMSMAFQSGQLAATALIPFLEGKASRLDMENHYRLAWDMQFAKRIRAGRLLQSLFGKPWKTKLFLQLLKPFPILTRQIIRKTHGNTF